MCIDAVAATIAAFGPVRTVDLHRCMRQGHDSVSNAIRILQHTGEIERLSYHGGVPSAVWVAR